MENFTKKMLVSLSVLFSFSLFAYAENVKVKSSFMEIITTAYKHNSLKLLPKKIEGKYAYGLKYTNWSNYKLIDYGSTQEEDNGLISMASETVYGYQCVGLVKAVSINTMGSTKNWQKGKKISMNSLPSFGDVIATFTSSGKYFGHVAIVLGASKDGIVVIDQNWDGTGDNPVGMIYIHNIDFSGTSTANASNYSIVKYP